MPIPVASLLAGLSAADRVALVSVVPAWTAAIERAAADLGVPLLVAEPRSIPMANLLPEPERVGTDRLVAAFAARELHGAPVIVVDLGTATTVDGVDASGAFAGGAILPGPELSGRALSRGTAQLPAVRMDTPDHALGRDTAEAIASGVILGQVDAISGLIRRIAAELVPARQRARVVLTGGGSMAPWATAIRGVDVVDPDLVMRGLGLLADRMAGVAGVMRAIRSMQVPRPPLAGRFILLGVTGSIAAYKAAELVRLLIAAGADVQVLMTHSAAQFIGPLTLETLSRRRVMLDPLELLPDRRIGHIVAADSADAILVAPATARWMAAMANGLSDDVITATALASTAPVIVAPGHGRRHVRPSGHARERRDAALVRLHDRRAGDRARWRPARSGQGAWRSCRSWSTRWNRPSPAARSASRTLDCVLRWTPPRCPRTWPGWHVLVTAGGTAEPIDPVRFIGNHSTGKMGAAIAEAALARGASVTLIKGTTSVPLPEAADIVDAPTTAEMRRAVLEHLPHADVLIMAAAVADFRPRQSSATKLDRSQGLTLELEATEDILAEASALARAAQAAGRLAPRRPVLVGFAAETGSLERASAKAVRKGVDLLVANDVSEPGSGFGTDTNRVTILVPGQPPEPWPQLTKLEVAHRILDRVVAIRGGWGASSAS